jgi:hypothetical protein
MGFPQGSSMSYTQIHAKKCDLSRQNLIARIGRVRTSIVRRNPQAEVPNTVLLVFEVVVEQK